MTTYHIKKVTLLILLCCISACVPVNLDHFRLDMDEKYYSHSFLTMDNGLPQIYRIKVKDGVIARIRLTILNNDDIRFHLTLLVPENSTLRLITDDVIVKSAEGNNTFQVEHLSAYVNRIESDFTTEDLLIGSTHRIRTVLIFYFNDLSREFYTHFDNKTFKSKNAFTIKLPEMKVNDVAVKLPILRFKRHNGWTVMPIN